MQSAGYYHSLNQGIIDTIREPLVIMDVELTVLFASRNFYESFRVTAEQTIGKRLYELGNGQWNIPALRTLLFRTLDREEAIEAFEVTHDFPDVGRRTMLLNARKIYSADQDSTTILLAIEDITERKASETELQASRAELELRSKELSKLVKNAEALNRKLSYEIDVKNKFFSIVAHDLKSPFTSLLGMTQVMSQMADRLNKEKLAEYAKDVNDAGGQVYELLENLLEWSRLQIEGGEIRREVASLHGIVQDCLNIHKPTVLEKDVMLSNKTRKDSVYVDQHMAKAVIRNLIANAVKFTSPGGWIEITSERKGGEIHVTVADSGVGMSPDQIETAFRLDKKTSTNGTAGEAGTGLGLPLCRDLLEKNDGQIWIDSVPGKGTRVHFSLPAKATKRTPESTPAPN